MRLDVAAKAPACQGPTVITAAWHPLPVVHDGTKDPLAVALGRRISAARLARGLTQDRLAELVGSRAPQVSRWERGEVMPEIRYAAPLADALGTTTDALLRDGADVLPAGLAELFSMRDAFAPPLTEADLDWCRAEVRSHGDVPALEWLKRIRAKRAGLTAEQQARQDEATGTARAVGAAKGVPLRRTRR